MTLAFSVPGWMVAIFVAVFVCVSVLLILTVLIQRPQGGGLSGAFGGGGGGAGSGQTAFGAKTGDALTWATVGMFVIWLLIAIGLNYLARPQMAPSGEAEARSTEEPDPERESPPPLDGGAPEGEPERRDATEGEPDPSGNGPD